MDKRVLDVVSTKFLTKKITVEIELEKLLNSNQESVEDLSNKIISKVEELRGVASDMQTWESILSQIQQAEEGDNKK